MEIAEQVEAYLAGQPEPKQADLRQFGTTAVCPLSRPPTGGRANGVRATAR
jgi:hypothetical protein